MRFITGERNEEEEEAQTGARVNNNDNEEAYVYLGVTGRHTGYSGGR